MFKTRPYLTVFAGIVLLFAVAPWIPAGIIPAIIPAAAPTANKRGNSNVFQLALNNSAATAGTPFCDDGSGNATTSGCTGGAVTSVFGQTGAVNIPVTTTDISTPSTPTAGKTTWYTKAGKLCSLDPSANENCTGGGAAGSGFLFSGATDPGVPNPILVQSNSIANNGYTLAFSSNVTSGNLLIVTAGWNNGSGSNLTTITDTVGTTYTQACGTNSGANFGTIYYGVAAASGPNTVTWSKTSSIDPVTAVQEASGLSGVLDVCTANSGSNAAVTTTVNYDMLISGLALNHSSSTCTAGASSTLDTQANGVDGVCAGHWNVGVAGSYTGTLIASTPSDTVFVNAAFKPTPVVTPGNNGDWYWNNTTGVVWGPKAGGTYAKSSGSFVSQTGSNGQFVLKGSPSLGTCGTSPSLATGASNNAGTITVGSGVVTACTLNFSPSFTNVPTCQVADNSTAITSAVTAVSVSAVTFSTSATIGGGKIYYSCF